MDCNLPGSSVHGVLQARILEWVAVPSSRVSSRPRDQIRSPALQVILYCLSHHGSQRILEWVVFLGDLPNPGIIPGYPELQVDSLPAELPGKAVYIFISVIGYYKMLNIFPVLLVDPCCLSTLYIVLCIC